MNISNKTNHIPIELTVNGQSIQLEKPMSLLAYMQIKNILPANTIVELNRAIVTNDQYETTMLHSGDVVEVLRFVGGG